ncbi:molecular chaperone [Chimaeribacter californicus]|uniref:Molecular chaperone n=1 Tax=Chimaeribacter californicus TaxID=2060067 RepID=A0A2N5EG57_9GAMM|nr:molecular chaperone [Chimaeribacter californicus]PLR41534.1 molecular chaperone [Chimaeribacter californicus]
MKLPVWAPLWCVLLSPFLSATAQAAAAILIWPIDPVIESSQQASALWLENRDSKPVYLQVRILSWRQGNGEDRYDSQTGVIPSPPVASIAPGKRQLVRLVRNSQVPAGQERAYRILVDEVPQGDAAPETNSLGLKFQMRYSVPLFVSGPGIWTKQDYEHPRDYAGAAQPVLQFRAVSAQGKAWLMVRNQGAVHARISRVSWLSGSRRTSLSEGLLGYVLPGQEMRFPLKQTVGGATRLEATVNDNPQPVTIPAY